MDRKTLTFIVLLVSITGFAGGLRLMFLSSSPPSANWDEAAMGYNAYSLLKTGADEYGYKLPTVFRSFDDYKPPIYPYLTVPMVWINGVNEVSARLVAAIFGTLNVLVLGILIRKMGGKKELALLGALVMATAPVLVNFSRMAFEANPALTLFLVGLTFVWRNVGKRNFLIGLLLVGLASFSYNSHKVYFGLFVIWQLKRILKDKLVFVLSTVITLATMFGGALGRFGSTSIFSIWNGDSLDFASQLINRYWSYFNPALVFARGSNEPSQHVIGFGVFFGFLFPFWALGLYSLFKKAGNWDFKYWLLVSPVPAVLTWNWFSPIRVLPLWMFMAMVIGIGVMRVWRYRLVRLGLLVCGLVSIISLVIALGLRMPYLEYGNWQWGFREVMAEISPRMGQYERIVWETPQAQPHIFTLFYGKYEPALYHQEIKWLADDKSPRKNFDFGKFEFRKIFWPEDRDSKNVLFIGTTESLKESDVVRDQREIKDILDPQGYVVARVVY